MRRNDLEVDVSLHHDVGNDMLRRLLHIGKAYVTERAHIVVRDLFPLVCRALILLLLLLALLLTLPSTSCFAAVFLASPRSHSRSTLFGSAINSLLRGLHRFVLRLLQRLRHATQPIHQSHVLLTSTRQRVSEGEGGRKSGKREREVG